MNNKFPILSFTQPLLALLGSVLCPFLFSMLTWNWDAQGGVLLLPIGLMYIILWFIPLLNTGVAIVHERLDPVHRSIIKKIGLLAFFLGVSLSAWAATLPSPIVRNEDLRCYTHTLPYFLQPECTEENSRKP